MEGNGYYGENGPGYGDGWGNSNRRGASNQGGGMYGNDSFAQKGPYFDEAAYGGAGLEAAARMTAYPLGHLGPAAQKMYQSSVYGNMDSGSQRDMSYGDGMPYGGGGSSFGSMDQSGGRRGFDNSGQSPFKQRDFGGAPQKHLNDYESDIAMMQGGSYAGSSPYGKGLSNRRNQEESSFSDFQQSGNFNSFGQKGSSFQKRPFGFRDFDSGDMDSGMSMAGMYDDSRYRLGSEDAGGFGGGRFGGAGRGRGGGRGRGRGMGMGRNDGGNDNWKTGQKRSSGFQSPWPKKRKNPNPGAKNPVSFLNEIRPDTNFIVGEMEGPSNNPTFRVSLEFDGETYTAAAKSKKLAKRYVAEAALKVYLNTTAAAQLGYSENQIEFSDGPTEEVMTGGAPVISERKTEEVDTSKADESIGGKNPVMYLNELKKDAVYDLKEETGQAHNKNFIMRVSVDGKEFEGTGQNKKAAKAAAARQALKSLGLVPDASNENEDDLVPPSAEVEEITELVEEASDLREQE